jgi:hypothetical protein
LTPFFALGLAGVAVASPEPVLYRLELAKAGATAVTCA